jgi:hypothetical protein
MKLELKHIAPYFPYGLNVVFDNKISGILSGIRPNLLTELIVMEELDNNTPIYKNWCLDDTKPVLKPLSDLNEDNARFLSSDGYMAVCEECIYVDEMHYSDVLKLIERHYDVFGLIEQGLAISYDDLFKLPSKEK